jgi:D-tagatose-1,6-bisphosphate aldolase subunit GatZ/KbaZ
MISFDHKILPVISENKKGNSTGIASICSANWYVIKAALLNAKKLSKQVLIESTSNQVNQFGGYTGLVPTAFKDKVYSLAYEIGFPTEDIILGGDHLGPNAWQTEPYEEAFKKAIDQIKAYIIAGFSKIHLDASAKCADDGDNEIPLDSAIIAERTALLCKAAEETYRQIKMDPGTIVYVIGTDVPPPGGAKGSHHSVRITSGEEVEDTILLTRKAFEKYNLQEVWERVIAVVVQPGVEFDDSFIFDYEPEKAINLSEKIKQIENIVYEAHSTDYQKKSSLKQMVRDHYAILKVGPWLTFAFREAVFALAFIENELYDPDDPQYSDLLKIVDCIMSENPRHWVNYYSGKNSGIRFSRRFSYSDRIRYYWPEQSISGALNKLIYNLKQKKIPLSLISQYLPEEFDAIRNGEISNRPEDLINHKITKILDIYNYATRVELP